jgi:hypothetical protein
VVIVLVGLAGLILLLLLGSLIDERAVGKQWALVLTPWRESIYDELARRTTGEAQLATHAFRRATEAHAAGSHEEAIRFLDLGLRMVERTSPGLLTLLRGMALVSRMANALAPVDALRPWAFNLPPLTGVALVETIVKRFVVGSTERFRLRVYVLGRGLGIAGRLLGRSVLRIHRQPEAGEEWGRVQAAHEDLGVLRTETLQAFHVLLRSFGRPPAT